MCIVGLLDNGSRLLGNGLDLLDGRKLGSRVNSERADLVESSFDGSSERHRADCRGRRRSERQHATAREGRTRLWHEVVPKQVEPDRSLVEARELVQERERWLSFSLEKLLRPRVDVRKQAHAALIIVTLCILEVAQQDVKEASIDLAAADQASQLRVHSVDLACGEQGLELIACALKALLAAPLQLRHEVVHAWKLSGGRLCVCDARAELRDEGVVQALEPGIHGRCHGAAGLGAGQDAAKSIIKVGRVGLGGNELPSTQ